MMVTHVRRELEFGVDPSVNLIQSGERVDISQVRILVDGARVLADYDVETQPQAGLGAAETALSISIVRDLRTYEDEFGVGDQRVIHNIEIAGQPFVVIIEFFEN